MSSRPCALAVLLAAVLSSLAAGQSATDAEVDRLVRLITTDKRREAGERLRELGATAVPRLLRYLQSPNLPDRMVALGCLQYCWSDEAVTAVARAATDVDHDVRQLALRVLAHQVQPPRLVEVLTPLADQANPRIAGPSMEMLEYFDPSPQRMRAAVAKPLMWNFVVNHLARHHAAELTAATITMLTSENPRVRAAAATGLIEQFADEARVRRRVVLLLSPSQPPLMRDLAAEHLRRFGTADELDALRQAGEREQDPWARASIDAAMARIQTRPALTAKDRGDHSFTPIWRYTHPRDDHPSQAMIDRSARLRRALGLVDTPIEPPASAPVADAWVTPVRNYLDEQRRSFGVQIDDPEMGPFLGRVHVGDDVAWRSEHETVVSVAAGVVRFVGVCERSWGGLVVVEHNLPDGTQVCSLYGHLDPLIPVREGQAVAVAQKIGTIGRTFTWDNGGYIAHLHLGVHQGSFADGNWIAGYLAPDAFRNQTHGWLDPQAFLRERTHK